MPDDLYKNNPYGGPVRRQTVSEFIRGSKPDWEHVRKRQVRSATQPFSGAPVVRIDHPAESTAEQLDAIDRQVLGLDAPMRMQGEVDELIVDEDGGGCSGLPG